MKKKLILLFVAISSLIGLSAFSFADDPFTELLKKLEEFTKKYPQEKIYLHLDKPYYAIGDDIWFKAYVVDSRTSAPSMISNILYVELINERDSIEKQLKLPMQSGITWGDFKLADSLTEGNYRIRAYTQWMRNAGPAFFFDKTIKIGNSWANKVFTSTNNVFSNDGKAETIRSTIKFTAKDGTPYANSTASYEVKLNGRNISRGRETTNANGEIVITYTNSQPNLYKSGQITANLTLPNKQVVTKIIPIKATTANIDVAFFPEGGDLVEGLPSKIGIKAINANGLGENVSGVLVDEVGTEVLQFETTHLGMGALAITPMANKTYTAKIKLPNGDIKTFSLPKAKSSGYVLSVNSTDTAKITAKILISESLLNKGELKLLAHHNGNIIFTGKVQTGKQLAVVNLLKKEFPSGVVQITLLDNENLPVCERLVFVNNGNDKINLDISDLKPSYNLRAQTSISLSASAENKPVQGSFSVAVTNTAVVKPDIENESNIFTTLLLTSDLTGYVEKPNYYFLNDDVKTRSALDNLLLTQGWRKFNWQQISSGQPVTVNFEAETTMNISGRITKGGKPVVNGKVSLFSNSGGFFATDTLSDANGRFNFKDIAFGDSTKFIVQARTGKDNKNVQIDLDVVPNQLVTPNKNTGDVEVNVNQSLMSYLNQSDAFFEQQIKKGFLNKTILLNEVKIVEKKNPTPNSANLNGAGRADQIFTAKDLETAFSLSQYLSGRVLGVTVRNGVAYSNRSNGGVMSIVLDGMNMGNDFNLDDIVVQDVESVEVLRTIGNTAIYGSNGANGVLVITTKRGGNSTSYNRYSPGIVTYAPKGYSISRQFYSPKYDVKPDDRPDLRSTVYWAPHIVTDANGKGNFNFFNTDQAGTYRIVIEGIDVFGNLARKVYTYEVK